MRFDVKDLGDAANVNSGEKERFSELIKLLLLATASILVIYFSLSFASEYFVRNISIEQEKKWFSHFNFNQFDLTPVDTKTNESMSAKIDQVEKILAQLSQNDSVPDLEYKIFVIQDNEINAFAFPGGTIAITSGLLTALEIQDTDDTNLALAFVIGHELGHFKYRHHLKGLSRTISIGLAFAILTGGSSDLSLINNVLTLLELNHSQQQETDSDLFSAKLVFDVYGSTKNIEKLFEVLKDKEQNALSFLNTHPSSETRISTLLNYSESLTE